MAQTSHLPKAPADSDYRMYPQAQVKLGQLLFYDRVLSGTYRVSCATCHSPDRASSNGFRLDGKTGGKHDDLAVNGLPVYDALKPSSRHAPALFNLGAREFQTLFSDGRVARADDGQFVSPAGTDLPDGLSDVLAVQALFPAVTGDELVGTVGNDVAAVAHLGHPAMWDVLARRIRDLPEYWPYFDAAFPELESSADISIVEIANAIAAFVGTEWRSDQSAFDAYLRGDKNALDERQKRGLDLFYGKARCSTCHSGAFQTDHKFHYIGMPLWRFDEIFKEGAGGVAAGGDVNIGRDRMSGKGADMFHFRTPSLRNVAVTGPYGQAGAFKTLEGAVRHHLDPATGLAEFFKARPALKINGSSPGAAFPFQKSLNDMPPVSLTEGEVDDLIAFLGSLTDWKNLSGRLGKPPEVPSSLALD